jgi:FixJ family two-component response regulator
MSALCMLGWSELFQSTAISAAADKPRTLLPHRNVVLVVDDDPGMLRSVARILRQFGYASLLFESAEAFANQRDFDEAVCVLLDINLGDVSGIELRHRLRAAGNAVPVIYMTGNDKPAVREAALQSGCLAYLTKPFSVASLAENLRRATAALRSSVG